MLLPITKLYHKITGPSSTPLRVYEGQTGAVAVASDVKAESGEFTPDSRNDENKTDVRIFSSITLGFELNQHCHPFKNLHRMYRCRDSVSSDCPVAGALPTTKKTFLVCATVRAQRLTPCAEIFKISAEKNKKKSSSVFVAGRKHDEINGYSGICDLIPVRQFSAEC
jgi:hypothetical protein